MIPDAYSIFMSCLICPEKVRVLCDLLSSFHHDFTLPFILHALDVPSLEQSLKVCFLGGAICVCGLVRFVAFSFNKRGLLVGKL